MPCGHISNFLIIQKASTTQETLKSVEEELCEQKQMNARLEKLSQEKEFSLDQQVGVQQPSFVVKARTVQSRVLELELSPSLQIKTLTEKLEVVESERDGLVSEEAARGQTSTVEREQLLSRVTTLSEEREQLQEVLEGVRQEERQLRAQLEDKMETLQTEVACVHVSTPALSAHTGYLCLTASYLTDGDSC